MAQLYGQLVYPESVLPKVTMAFDPAPSLVGTSVSSGLGLGLGSSLSTDAGAFVYARLLRRLEHMATSLHLLHHLQTSRTSSDCSQSLSRSLVLISLA